MKTPRLLPFVAASASLLSLLPVTAHAAAVPGRGTWESTLFARDINGDGLVDAYFDSTRNVTWLADAKAVKGTAFDDGFNSNDGRVTYASAKSWLDALNVYGVTGWRFPGADLLPLYGITLGNSSIPGSPTTGWTNTGMFLNVPDFAASGWYWRGDTPFQDNPSPAPGEPLKSNILAADGLGAPIYVVAVTASYNAWAVKAGDVPVAAIPEPTTWTLMLLGVGALAWRQKQAKR